MSRLILFKKFYASGIGIALCLSSGCLPKTFEDGHFEGTLQFRSGLVEGIGENPTDNQTQSLTPPSSNSSLVSIDLQFEKPDRGDAEVRDLRGKVLYSIHFEKLRRKKFYISISSISPELVKLRAEPKSMGCFSSSGDLMIQACLKKDKFLLQVSHKGSVAFFTLTGDRFVKEEEFPLEDPVRLTLPEAVSRTFRQNFDNRMQFQRTLQARLTAKAAFMNLVPHLNLTNLLTNFPLTFFSVLAVTGDLAPFLLPNRWFVAKEAGQLFQVEKYAQILMQADLVAQVEGLAYALQRDESILRFTNSTANRIKEIRDKVFDFESRDQFPKGSTDHLSAYANDLDLAINSLEEIVLLDKRALAQALGYHNPDAIEAIDFHPDQVRLEQAVALDSKKLGEIVLQRSLELQQIDALIIYSIYKKKEVYFSFLDPITDPGIELGVNLGYTVAAGDARIEELKIKRQQLQAILLEKVTANVVRYNYAIKASVLLKAGFEIQVRRERKILDQVIAYSEFNTLDIVSVFQEYLTIFMQEKNAQAGYRVARANIDRLLLQGYYTQLFLDYFGPAKPPVPNIPGDPDLDPIIP